MTTIGHFNMNFLRTAPLALLLLANTPAAQSGILVSSRNTDQILEYDAAGNFVRVFASGAELDNPVGIAFSPAGHVVVASANTNQILEYDRVTGRLRRVIASGLGGLRNLNYGPDGHLYACRGDISAVVRIDRVSGNVTTFASHPSISRPTSLTFGPDFHLYVGSVANSQVARFDGRTGTFRDIFATGDQNGTHDLSFGPDGHLDVSNAFGTLSVVRFHGITGAPLGVFVQDPRLQFPLGLSWDEAGDLYVANQGANEVRRYDGSTGAPKGRLVKTGVGGVSGPLFAVWIHRPTMAFLPPTSPAGVDGHFALRGVRSGGVSLLTVGLRRGSLPSPCGNFTLGLGDPILLGYGAADESGQLVRKILVPNGIQGIPLLFQGIDLTGCAASPVVSHSF